MREGVVLRPLIEVTTHLGERVIAKHKRPEFSERASNPEVNPGAREVLSAAEAIAAEFVTEMRLAHVLDKLGNPSDMSATKAVILAMIEDVTREARGEIVESKEAATAIGRKTVHLFKAHCQKGVARA